MQWLVILRNKRTLVYVVQASQYFITHFLSILLIIKQYFRFLLSHFQLHTKFNKELQVSRCLGSLLLQPLPRAEMFRTAQSNGCPTFAWKLPVMKHPQFLEASCIIALRQKIILYFKFRSSFVKALFIGPCSAFRIYFIIYKTYMATYHILQLLKQEVVCKT